MANAVSPDVFLARRQGRYEVSFLFPTGLIEAVAPTSTIGRSRDSVHLEDCRLARRKATILGGEGRKVGPQDDV